MPLIVFSDMIWYQGTKRNFDLYSLCASYYAGREIGIETVVQSDPPVYFPRFPSESNIWLFLYEFARIFQILVSAVERELGR